jgi:D-threo-aldose 1-dehydrogenase
MAPLSTQQRRLGARSGREGFLVTCLGFGAAPIGGPQLTDAEALDAVEAAIASGATFFDTAPWYSRGLSERRLGLALGCHPRDSYRLQTKVGRFIVPGQPNDRDSSGAAIGPGCNYPPAHGREYGVTHDYSFDAVVRQHQDSLQRLGVSRVDSLVIHDLDLGYGSREQCERYLRELGEGGGARALADLRAQGTIRAFGCGCNHFTASTRSDEFARRVAEVADLDFFLIAGGHYTLLDQQALDVQFPIMAERDMRAVIGTPLASGLLAGRRTDDDAEMEKVDAMGALCRRFGTDVKAAALQFPLAHPAVACIIPGGANRAESAENTALVDFAIPRGLWRHLKEAGMVRGDAPTPGNADANM